MDNLFSSWKKQVDLPCSGSDSEDDGDDNALYKRFISQLRRGI